MRYGKKIEGVEYIEITEERYNHVETKFKYVSYRGGKKYYHLARNRLGLENIIHDGEVMDRLVKKIKEINRK